MNIRKRKKQILSLLLCVALLCSYVPQGFATVSADQGSCKHHTEHTEDCGYSQGSDCTHQHTDACYAGVIKWLCGDNASEEAATASEVSFVLNTAADNTRVGHVHDENCPYENERVLNCSHAHDDQCGYAEGSVCQYVCAICNVQALIDELPSADELAEMTTEEQNAAYEQYLAACDAWDSLSEEEQESIDVSLLHELSEWFNEQIQMFSEDGVAFVNGVGYDSLLEAYIAATDGDTIVLKENVNVKLTEPMTIQKEVTIDLNGGTITETSNGFAVFSVLSAGKLTLTGTGTVQGDNHSYGILYIY